MTDDEMKAEVLRRMKTLGGHRGPATQPSPEQPVTYPGGGAEPYRGPRSDVIRDPREGEIPYGTFSPEGPIGEMGQRGVLEGEAEEAIHRASLERQYLEEQRQAYIRARRRQ